MADPGFPGDRRQRRCAGPSRSFARPSRSLWPATSTPTRMRWARCSGSGTPWPPVARGWPVRGANRSSGRPTWLAALDDGGLIVDPSAIPEAPPVMVTLDAASIDRLGSLVPTARRAGELIMVDHHRTNPGFGSIDVLDPDASSTAEIVFRLIDGGRLPPHRRGRRVPVRGHRHRLRPVPVPGHDAPDAPGGGRTPANGASTTPRWPRRCTPTTLSRSCGSSTSPSAGWPTSPRRAWSGPTSCSRTSTPPASTSARRTTSWTSSARRGRPTWPAS